MGEVNLLDMEWQDAIRECGRLGISKERMLMVLASKVGASKLDEIMESMENPDSEIYSIYEEGKAIGETELDTALFQQAVKGDNKDGYKNLAEYRKNKALDDSIQKNFPSDRS
jgi:hypothetical protein